MSYSFHVAKIWVACAQKDMQLETYVENLGRFRLGSIRNTWISISAILLPGAEYW